MVENLGWVLIIRRYYIKNAIKMEKIEPITNAKMTFCLFFDFTG
jgi:hypothetical protein